MCDFAYHQEARRKQRVIERKQMCQRQLQAENPMVNSQTVNSAFILISAYFSYTIAGMDKASLSVNLYWPFTLGLWP